VTQTTERPARPAAAGRGPAQRVALYYRQIVAELRKVIWPTRPELVTYTAVVIVFVTAMVALVALFDFVFTKLVIALFG
jgi:preprotein translocase subunit SecE